MTNPQIELEARQTVLDQVVAGASFTAYEITLEVRRRLGAGVEVPHPLVNGVVQTMFSGGQMPGYDRAPDASVKAATPPFRYAPRAATPANTSPAPIQSAPAVIGVNRAALPVALRYSNPIAALIREIALEARAFHDAAGIGDTPFDVWLPTAQDPRFRVRSYGAVPTEAEVLARYALSPAVTSDFGARAAYAYADEFRVSTFQGGRAKTFRCALDMAGIGTVTKDGEVPTNQGDGVEVEVPIGASLLRANHVGHEAARVFDFFRVPPRVRGGALGGSQRGEVLFEGDRWKVTRGGSSFAVVDDVGFPVSTGLLLSRNLGGMRTSLGVELAFAPDKLEVSETGEALIFSGATQDRLAAAVVRLERELAPLLRERIASAPNIWEAKIRFAQLTGEMGDYLPRVLRSAGRPLEWSGIAIQNDWFNSFDRAQVTVRATSRTPFGTRLRTQDTPLTAQEDAVVFINDLGTKTGSPTRLLPYMAANPGVGRAYVLTFASDDAKARFFADNHFETVPTLLLSSLPKPASTRPKSLRLSLRLPFDPTKHAVLPPQNMALGAEGADFEKLRRELRGAPLDGATWPDFKRAWKALETRVWPLQTRARWKKTESDLPPDAPLATEREALLLGVLIGRLDSETARRGDPKRLPNGGPTRATVAYLTRRAERLLRFLAEQTELAPERRALLAPLVLGSLQRAQSGDIARTLAFRLGLQDTVFAARPDLVRALWSDDALPIPILAWAWEWLTRRGETPAATPEHALRFATSAAPQLALAVVRAALSANPNADWKPLARQLQEARFLPVRGELLLLFARFRQIEPSEGWVLRALDAPEADEPEVVAWATPLVEARARAAQFALAKQLLPTLRAVFCAALTGARPDGLTLAEWGTVAAQELLEPLAPALMAMKMAPAVAEWLWNQPALRAQFWQLGGEARFAEAFAARIEAAASAEDFDFAALLPPLGRAHFFAALAPNLSVATWRKLAALPSQTFADNLTALPLTGALWAFLSELDAPQGAAWLERIGRARANNAFAELPAHAVLPLMEANKGGLDSLLEAWFAAHLPTMAGDEPLLFAAATSLNEEFRAPALARLRQTPLNLRAGLRLMESGLPEGLALARPFFEAENDEWPARVLALCDSPKSETQHAGLDLLARFPARWTPALLEQLAQHDAPRVRAFVAAQLQTAPATAPIAAFDTSILNTRGSSRRAKNLVQLRLRHAQTTDVATLLDAARTGAGRDREWALAQLVRLRLSGVEVEGLRVSP